MEAQALGFAVAFTAGLLSFLSPCVLPLIPSYASFITGLGLDELTARDGDRAQARKAVLTHGILFILGFTLVFIALGASATFLGSLFAYYRTWVERLGGALLVVFGLYLLGVLRLPGANRDWRIHLANKPVGYLGSLVVGITFGAGWTPCIGPVLGGILTLAGTRESIGEGVALLGMYSAGLAIPFLGATLALDRFLAGFRRMSRWLPWITRLSGVLLILVGALLLTGSFSLLASMMARWTPAFLLDRL
ncbi:MAG TPA: cytochrome c biogenesis protein CcdA [Longimicrobiales bacterium]|nr:cytochrome c biogenesis protein CcdA [Longimicrobiales bacterium]